VTVGGRLVVRVLDGFEAILDGRRLSRADWQRSTAERLVKLLLVSPGHRLSREVAAETLWPDAEPETSRANLRKALHYAGGALAGSDALTATDGFVSIVPERLELDLDRLRAALDSLSRPASGEALVASPSGALDTVLELGARDLLPDDRYEDWLAGPREQLRSQWQRTAIAAARRARADRRIADAHQIVDVLLQRDPTDEAAHRLAIELFAADGRHHAVRLQFERCRQALRDELDADPSPETVAAFEVALGRSRDDPAANASRADGRPRLVARRPELEQMESLLDQVAAGQPARLVIRGPAGIGKSRLLEELITYAKAADVQVIWWQAVESGQALGYAPFRLAFASLLREADVDAWEEPARSAVAALVPGMCAGGTLTFEDRSALVTGLVEAIEHVARERPVLIVVDDLPWLDESSVELLGAIISGLPTTPLMLATTHRDDEPVPDRVTRLLDQVRRVGAIELRLGPLGARDVEPLITGHLGGGTVQPELARDVFEQSEGNPLFCLELVRSGLAQAEIRRVDGRWSLAAGASLHQLPESIRNLVAARSAVLPNQIRELLAVAAELGAQFSFDTLAAVVPAVDGGLLRAIDAAIEAGLLVEREAAYAFAHPLYRLAVRDSSGSRRRGSTCLAIGRALAGVADPEGSLADLATSAATCDDPVPVADLALTAVDLGVIGARPLAVAYGFTAGIRARHLFDATLATTLLERSLAVWRRLPRRIAEEINASEACLVLAYLYFTSRREEAASAQLREAIAIARTPAELADSYVALAWIPYRHGDFEAALSIYEEGRSQLPIHATAARAMIDRERGWCYARLRRHSEAIALLEASVDALDAPGLAQELMKALDFLGDVHNMTGRYDQAIALLERALAIAIAIDDSQGEIPVRMHIVSTLTRMGVPARARPHLERAMELARLVGNRYDQAVASWVAADMACALGDREAAIGHRRQELECLEAIGGNPHNEALAHAHIAHLARLNGDTAMAETEGAAARRHALRSPDPGYPARIEVALAIESWSEFEH
jgi:DNA-binding SARP family transcriptional activator/tetratricopeptide (TPR) repeat protein